MYWASLATLPFLPATAAPIGLTADGLPVGIQIIGREGDDLTAVEFARLLAAETGGYAAAAVSRIMGQRVLTTEN